MSQPCKLPDENVAIIVFEDEVLEFIWEREEEAGAVFFDEVLDRMGHRERLESMGHAGLFSLGTGGSVSFSDAGRSRARDIIRRHRLAERLFMDVLDIKDYEQDACHIEHSLSREAEEAICTLLGHPPRCPHNKPIPPGNCCAVFTRKVKPLAMSLRDMEVGREGRVVFINVPAMDRLANMGLVPGAVIRLVQKRPSFVIEIDETSLALDEDIARGIYVKQIQLV